MSSDPFRELALTSNDHLEQYLRAARGPAPESLAGFEWRGFNLSWRVKLLGLQKFVKGFFEAGSGVEGYNIPVLQNGLDRPWRQQPTPEDPRRYAFYRVTRVDAQSVDQSLPASHPARLRRQPAQPAAGRRAAAARLRRSARPGQRGAAVGQGLLRVRALSAGVEFLRHRAAGPDRVEAIKSPNGNHRHKSASDSRLCEALHSNCVTGDMVEYPA